jgi:hypothetical protein
MSRRSDDCSAKNLLELRVIIPTLRVNIVSLEILPVNGASNRGIGVSVTIRMKSWLSKISGNG